ncbi:hypothetical protein [Demequina activiva]|uniref:Leucine rich repeat variant n=1 Tax=Demequina activiva TaxID=1582364 RepID=A0A919UKD8_9MICO|nr:hypothetical protein [Demequina activiva]GIG53608.1 hypothetical protein Dac01nite_03600 [Demequina activiva]
MHEPRKPWTPQSRRALREILAHPSHERAVQLAASRNTAVRAALAAARETPIGVLIHLSTDPEAAVRAAVAGNQAVAVSVSTMRRLGRDADASVRAALEANTFVPAALRDARSSVAA